MNDFRKGQIALLILKCEACKSGVMFGLKAKNQIVESAKEVGLSTEEVLAFMETVVIDLVKLTFGLESIQPEHPVKEARVWEIALIVVKQKMLHKGIRLDSTMKRDAGNVAKEIGVSIEEVIEFQKAMALELINEM